MEDFRHNLTPVEVKIFLKTIAKYSDNLLIRCCNKVTTPCPQCGRKELCSSGAVSLLASRIDKVTHTIRACLHCGYVASSMVLTIEKL